MAEREDWVDSRSLASRNIRSEGRYREHDRDDQEQRDDVGLIVAAREGRLEQLPRTHARHHSNAQSHQGEHEALPQHHSYHCRAVRALALSDAHEDEVFRDLSVRG